MALAPENSDHTDKYRQEVAVTAEDRPANPEMSFTETQSELLGALRARYQLDGDLFTGRELSHLRFWRWLQGTRPPTEDSSSRRYSLMRLEPGVGR